MAGSDSPPSESAGWITAYRKVDGTLPPDDFPNADVVWIKCLVNIQVAGKVKLEIKATEGLEL